MRQELAAGLEYIRQRLEWEGPFDPLHDSEHALRLMALLQIELRYDWEKSTEIVITRPVPDDRRSVGGWCTEDFDGDREEAIRACITGSAACVGRDMLAKLRPKLPEPTKSKRPNQIPKGTLLPIDDVIYQWNGQEWDPLTLNEKMSDNDRNN